MALAEAVFHAMLLNFKAAGVTGMALGMVMQLPDQDDETSVSRRQLLAKLDVCMGGRVAEELIFGESNITTGMLRTRTIILGVTALPNTTLRVIWVICVMHSCLHATAYTSQVVRLASGVSNPCVRLHLLYLFSRMMAVLL